MKLLIKTLPLVSALLVSNTLSAQTSSQQAELDGSALILSIYDLNDDGTVDPTTERLNFSGTFRALRALTLEDFPQLPALGIPASLVQFDVNNDGVLDRNESREASRGVARAERRAEIQELAEQFDVSRRQVREVRRFLRGDSSSPTLAAELVPVRDEIVARRAARRSQAAADRAALLDSVDSNGNGTLEFSEFLALPETRGILSSRPDRLVANLRVQLSAFVRRDLNGDQSLELSEFTTNTGSFLGE